MKTENIYKKLKDIYTPDEINILKESKDKFRILTPITFRDGDHIVCTLKKIKNDWYLSDEAFTLMKLNADINDEILNKVLLDNKLEIKDGEIITPIYNDISKAFKNFINGIMYLISIQDYIDKKTELDDDL